MTKTEMARLWKAADAAGKAAAEDCTPTPMYVVQRADPLNDRSPIVRQYAPVMGGVCGFAWIWFKGNTAWGRWSKQTGKASADYPTGLSVWVGDYGQSMERKEAYARAFAKVLQNAGIEAHARSRMD